ncbi:hypothetical protein GT045_21210 [Streptomyces sp. SID486]|uniref:DUF6081 family protein n=1 Tax=unclassified Streptomyces TaxID=2593676 RepID=UPI00136BBDF7|nr:MULTISPECIES: DUF6081 family protein [unclassified Streptomyces]MYW42205.1 hypothetical protein [Streptomyces sp. SID161]MYX97269.1 hypothetical protein [Streptomyces sp. SID486]
MTLLFHDDFAEGLRVRDPRKRPDGPWSLRPAGPLTAGDGIARATAAGLVVQPTGTDPDTGHPAFVVPPEGEAVDHLRWAAFGPACATGGATLTVSATLSAQVLGVVRDESADEDIRDGASTLVVLDRDAGLIMNFALTETRVWALYGRVPAPDGTRGGFSYSVPLASRGSSDRHHCALAVDSAAGTARWLLDGDEVFAVERLGHGLPEPVRAVSWTPGPLPAVRPASLTPGLALIADSPHGQGAQLTVADLSVTRSGPSGGRSGPPVRQGVAG